MQYRRDRYVITNDLIVNLQETLTLSLETGDRFTIALSQFDLGFACLWVRDFEGAAEHLSKSLESLERSGDLIQQARCLTYLTSLYRMNGEPERALEFAFRSLEKATAAEMDEYIGSARANLAWLAWQQGDFEEAEGKARRALQLWEQTPLVYSFYWLALCSLIAVTIERNRIAEAIEFVRILLQDPQMRLHDELEVVLQDAIVAWENDDLDNAQLCLNKVIDLSAQLGYL
jgi:tetratricopeptide (TPR) repeat protein